MYILSFVLTLWSVFLSYKFVRITWFPQPEPNFDSDSEPEDETDDDPYVY